MRSRRILIVLVLALIAATLTLHAIAPFPFAPLHLATFRPRPIRETRKPCNPRRSRSAPRRLE